MSPAPDVARRPIQRLDPATIERIAAGEVVERPASVVKELVENALDAGATAISVKLDEGGLTRIEVADDGIGIPPDELRLAVERHATSKLAPGGPIDEVEALGFRGEALAAIGTVARLRIVSRTPDADGATRLAVDGGTVGRTGPAARAIGTTVTVDDLFYNTPARRKYLRSPAAEQVETVATVERLYLARPDVTFRVRSGTRELAVYPAARELRDAATRVLGPALLRESFVVDGEVPGGHVHGVLGHPSTAISSGRGLYLAVNGRAVLSRPLGQAVRAAFGDYLPRSRFPVGALAFTLSPDRVDVNVHPTKREVRFLRERDLGERLRRVVREALLSAPAAAEPRGSARAAAPSRAAEPARPPPDEPAVVVPHARGRVTHQRALLPEPAGDAPTPVAARGPHASLALIGCVGAIYWVAESDDGLVLIDQHAASERVVYETLRRDGILARQALVAPVRLTLSGVQRAALDAHAAEVRSAGFDVEAFGPGTLRLRSVPAYRGRLARPEALLELLGELAEGGRPTVPDGLAERTAASIACHAAIRAGDIVEREVFARVLGALRDLPEASYACPHGRPIQVHLSRSRLDRWFLRAGP
jgi:DNA mismatch repair protein MutL